MEASNEEVSDAEVLIVPLDPTAGPLSNDHYLLPLKLVLSNWRDHEGKSKQHISCNICFLNDLIATNDVPGAPSVERKWIVLSRSTSPIIRHFKLVHQEVWMYLQRVSEYYTKVSSSTFQQQHILTLQQAGEGKKGGRGKKKRASSGQVKRTFVVIKHAESLLSRL